MATKTDDTLSVRRNRKEEAVSFLRLTSSGAVAEAFESYIGDHFRHHNPYFPADTKSLAAAMEQSAAANPERTFEVMLEIEEGDLVAVYSRVRMAPDGPAMGVVHIFRFKDDRIVEMWDIGQEEPEESPNQNGMF